MKIILLSGAIKNSGDYLITERCREILQYVYPDAEIKKMIGNYPLGDQLTEVNSADVMIIAGGPSYTKRLYPKDIPLVEELNRIRCKICILGSGWYGSLTTDREIYNYHFEKSSKTLLKRISNDTEKLGCRDFYAVRVLQSNGFNNGVMTGCPAWYDIDKISNRLVLKREIKKIMVSDPANAQAFGMQSIAVVQYLRQIYPKAVIEYVFHRGINADRLTSAFTGRYIEKVVSELKKLGVTYHDISYGCEGFTLYDNCDIHIGYRVHAHIYNLSQRRLSILIEEDSRGAGVNEALGLWRIKGYEWKLSSNANPMLKMANKFTSLVKPNRYVIKDIEDYLMYIFESQADLFNISFGVMEHYFNEMIQHVSSIKEFI